MGETTFFHGKNGRLTSLRTSTPLVSVTNPLDGRSGGITFHNGRFTSRFEGGTFTGSSIKMGNYTTYFGKTGQHKDRLTPFTRRNS